MTSDVDWWFNDATGPGWFDFYITPDPANSNLIHGDASSNLFPNGYFGNLFYVRSDDGGKTFSPLRQVYSMVDDPVWQAEKFDPDFTSDPNYFIYGGISLHSANPVVVDENVVLLPILRAYPTVGSTTFTPFSDYVNSTYDQAVVRSLDKGKTWSKVAGATDPYNAIPIFHDPAFVPTPINPYPGYFLTFSGQASTPVVSPFTGRVYLAYDAGNPASNPDPNIVNVFPYVLLSASSDQGATWSHAVQINRTPTNIPFGAQQAAAHDMIMTLDGSLVVSYYDLRNWTGHPGEDVHTTPLPMDAWIAIYKEVDDPRGGSTGVGLDFVEEIRLTPQSFNARIGTLTPFNSATGTPEGTRLAVNNKNELFVLFSTTNIISPLNIP